MRVDVMLSLLDRTVNDQDFREAASHDPNAVLTRHGYALSPEEYDAFLDLNSKAVRMSAGLLV